MTVSNIANSMKIQALTHPTVTLAAGVAAIAATIVVATAGAPLAAVPIYLVAVAIAFFVYKNRETVFPRLIGEYGLEEDRLYGTIKNTEEFNEFKAEKMLNAPNWLKHLGFFVMTSYEDKNTMRIHSSINR